MPQVKKQTRYLLATFRGSSRHKKFYRRGGVRFDLNVEQLVDVTNRSPEQILAILNDKHLNVRELTEKQAEKYQRLLSKSEEEQSQERDADTEALTEALTKYRKMYRNERERAADMERQNAELIESLDLAQARNDELDTRLAELSGRLEALEEQATAPATDDQEPAGE